MKKKPLVILDLDETLIYASEQQFKHLKSVRFQKIYINFRPFLFDFVSFLEAHFELAVWTSATENYAEFVVKHIFDIKPHFLFTRKDCSLKSDTKYKKSQFYKNLNRFEMLQNNFEKIIFLDDKPELIISDKAEIIPILPFKGEKSDSLLLNLRKEFERYI